MGRRCDGNTCSSLASAPGARLGDARDPGRRAETDGDGHRLLVVEQQGRQLSSGTEPVAADGSARGVDGIAEVAQSLDVVSDSARRDAETRREVASGALRTGLQERQQREQTSGRVGHRNSSKVICLLGTNPT